MKASIVEIDSRRTRLNKKLGIIENGEDNLYAERAQQMVSNSVTAKMAASIMATYIAGKGFGDAFDMFEIQPRGKGKQAIKLKGFAQKLARSFAIHRGAFVQIFYNALNEPSRFKLLPYTHCRLGKKDDDDYNGKILIYRDWAKANTKEIKDNAICIDVFNPDKKIVAAQMENAGGVLKYKGQIMFINFDEDEFDYPLCQADAALNDCDSEAQASVFKNRSLRRGFFGKTMFITKPLTGNLEDYETPELFAQAESEREEFKRTLDEFMGAENVGGTLVVESDAADGDTLDDALKVQNITSDIDDKLFEHTEESTQKNILVSFNNMPAGLVRSDNTLFGTSGEAFKQMKEVYQENTIHERTILENVVSDLVSLIKGEEIKLKVIPLIKIEENDIIS